MRDDPPLAETPIFIFGVSQRSGTNFLANLLLCHDDCAAPEPPVLEGHFLADAPRLFEYARSTAGRWPRRWGDGDAARSALVRGLGRGVEAFVQARVEPGTRAVVKTPSTENLLHHPELFPTAPVLLLVRDGRSVVESLHTGFRRSYTRAITQWRAGARDISAFVGRAASTWPDLPWRVVRYEELAGEPDRVVPELLEFLGLDPARFDADRARELPVYGSSFVKVDGGLTWEPVARDQAFAPTVRFGDWPPRLHERFEWLAGAEQVALGYDLEPVHRSKLLRVLHNLSLAAVSPAIAVRDGVMRLRWRVRSRLRRSGVRSDSTEPGYGSEASYDDSRKKVSRHAS